MLSIIIPHKNSIRLLERALLSAPISESVEIIVVDDHSHTSERANVLAPAFPSVIFLNNRNANRGAGAARNMGLEHSKGEWIIFLDADDYFEAGFSSTRLFRIFATILRQIAFTLGLEQHQCRMRQAIESDILPSIVRLLDSFRTRMTHY